MNRTNLKILLFSLLMLATFYSALFLERYSIIEPQLIANTDFSSNLTKWNFHQKNSDQITVKNGLLSLQSSDSAGSVSLYRIIPNTFSGKLLQLKGMICSEDIVAGAKPYNKARLLLVQYRHGKADWRLPHTVIALEGTTGWQDVRAAFPIAAASSELRVVIQLSNCSGEFFIKDLSLYQVKETTLYRWLKWFLQGAWISFICFLFVSYLKKGKVIVSKFPVFITVSIILIGTAMPGTVKNTIKKTIDDELTTEINKISAQVLSVKTSPPQLDWLRKMMKQIDITKIGHFTLFALLALILRYNNPSRPIPLLLLDIFMLACATELNQFFVENRSPLFTDVIIDMTGAGAGVLLFRNKANQHADRTGGRSQRIRVGII